MALLVVFMGIGLVFSWFNFPTPKVFFLVAGIGIAYRLAELIAVRTDRSLPLRSARLLAWASVSWNLVLPFGLAAATQQFHSHYFGLLILPVIEASLYFSFPLTLAVSAAASFCAFLWVAYAANFHLPFRLGELLEATTLVLLYFIVGVLVWWLIDLLGDRGEQLRHRLTDLETTRTKLVQEEKLAAVGRLASSVAHEIRNPVAIISSAIEAATSPGLPLKDREEMSQVAVIEARRLEKLTTDFLLYAQPGTPPLSEVDATALVGHIAAIGRAQGLQKQLKLDLHIDSDCSVLGHEGQLQQALLNLLRNAIEASPDFGQVAVEVKRVENRVRIAFENGGPPIPPHAAPQIFEPFFTAKHGGTGLGLAIAKSIVDKHGGSLFLEQNEPERITFVLMLPSFAVSRGHSSVATGNDPTHG